MSITLNEITLRTEKPMRTIRLCYERAHLMVSDLFNEYFDAGINPDDQGEWWKLAHGFHNAETRSEIILDAMAQIRDALAEVEAVMEQIEKSTPSPAIDAITGAVVIAAATQTKGKKVMA